MASDTERMDWIRAQLAGYVPGKGVRIVQLFSPEASDGRPETFMVSPAHQSGLRFLFHGATIDEAIDAAIENRDTTHPAKL